MSSLSPFSSQLALPSGFRLPAEQRRHKRIALTLLGRFMRQSKHEYPCKLMDISVGGLAMKSPVVADVSERIVVYFDQIGGLEGTVARQFEGGFALKLSISAHKREKLAAQLTWLLNKDDLKGLEQRRHDRTVAVNRLATLQLAGDITIECQLIDISVSGASIETEARPPIGSEVVLGKQRGRVSRHHERGISLEFLDLQDPEVLRRHFL